MTNVNGRSAAAKKANETRKRNKYEQVREEKLQAARRSFLWHKMTEAEHDLVLDELHGATRTFAKKLEEWFLEQQEEAKHALRTLLRQGVKYTTILAAIESGYVESTYSTGRGGGFSFSYADLLEDVVYEDEFLETEQLTPAAQQKMWEVTETYIGADEVVGMDESEYDIPPALPEPVAA
jgi:thiamine biosynthesis protein ThiC